MSAPESQPPDRTTTTNVVSSSSKRSWRRFTLRALFLVVLAAAIFCGWVAYRARFLQQQYAWIREFQSSRRGLTLKPISNEWFWRPLIGDAAVTVKRAFLNRYSYEEKRYDLTEDLLEQVKGWTEIEELFLAGPVVTDDTIGFVKNFRELTLLALENTRVTDAGTAHFAHLHGVKTFCIVRNAGKSPPAEVTISDASLRNIVRGKNLDVLGLAGNITDEGLSFIVGNCPNLTRLQLTGALVTDRGLAHLRSLTKLAVVHIWDAPAIDDAAALTLARIPSIKSVWLTGTSVSQRGYAALKAALPRAEVLDMGSPWNLRISRSR